jgi:hypothetical protein
MLAAQIPAASQGKRVNLGNQCGLRDFIAILHLLTARESATRMSFSSVVGDMNFVQSALPWLTHFVKLWPRSRTSR